MSLAESKEISNDTQVQLNESQIPTIIQLWESGKTPEVKEILKNIPTDMPWENDVTDLARNNMLNYFSDREKCKIAPWFFFLYAKHFRCSPVEVGRVLSSYAEQIEFREDRFMPEFGKFNGKFYQAHIDPRWWFGELTKYEKLPRFYSEILENRFTALKFQYPPGTVFLVSSYGRVECELPTNFHIDFIKHLQSLKMFTETNGVCRQYEKYSMFSRNLAELTDDEVFGLVVDWSNQYDRSIFA